MLSPNLGAFLVFYSPRSSLIYQCKYSFEFADKTAAETVSQQRVNSQPVDGRQTA